MTADTKRDSNPSNSKILDKVAELNQITPAAFVSHTSITESKTPTPLDTSAVAEVKIKEPRPLSRSEVQKLLELENESDRFCKRLEVMEKVVLRMINMDEIEDCHERKHLPRGDLDARLEALNIKMAQLPYSEYILTFPPDPDFAEFEPFIRKWEAIPFKDQEIYDLFLKKARSSILEINFAYFLGQLYRREELANAEEQLTRLEQEFFKFEKTAHYVEYMRKEALYKKYPPNTSIGEILSKDGAFKKQDDADYAATVQEQEATPTLRSLSFPRARFMMLAVKLVTRIRKKKLAFREADELNKIIPDFVGFIRAGNVKLDGNSDHAMLKLRLFLEAESTKVYVGAAKLKEIIFEFITFLEVKKVELLELREDNGELEQVISNFVALKRAAKGKLLMSLFPAAESKASVPLDTTAVAKKAPLQAAALAKSMAGVTGPASSSSESTVPVKSAPMGLI